MYEILGRDLLPSERAARLTRLRLEGVFDFLREGSYILLSSLSGLLIEAYTPLPCVEAGERIPLRMSA